MATKHHRIPKDLLPALQAQLALLQQHFPPDRTLYTSGKALSVAQIAQQYASLFADFEEPKRLRILLETALQRRTARVPEAVALRDRVKALLTAHFGVGHPVLDAPGLRRHGGARKLTVEQQLVKQVKAQETKKLQGRLTKAEKKARTFRGTVDVKAVLAKGGGK